MTRFLHFQSISKKNHYQPDKIYHIKDKSNLKRIKKKTAVLMTVLYCASMSHNNTSNNSDQLTNQNNMSMRCMMPIKGNKEVDCYCNIKKKYCLIKLFKICKDLVDCHTKYFSPDGKDIWAARQYWKHKIIDKKKKRYICSAIRHCSQFMWFFVYILRKKRKKKCSWQPVSIFDWSFRESINN